MASLVIFAVASILTDEANTIVVYKDSSSKEAMASDELFMINLSRGIFRDARCYDCVFQTEFGVRGMHIAYLRTSFDMVL